MLSLDLSPSLFALRLRRRQLLAAGGLAAAGLCGSQVGAEIAAPAGFGRAKRCLLLFLTGGPPQHDTFDPKPDAPAEVRGELASIATSAPGITFTELFPRLAQEAHRFRVLRSLTHADTVHTTAGYAMFTGEPHRNANKSLNGSAPPTPEDRPNLASLAYQYYRGDANRLPPIALPEIIKDAAVNEFPGQNAGFFGKGFDPLLIEADPGRTSFLPPTITLPVDVPSTRLAGRVELRRRFEQRIDRFDNHVSRDVETLFESGCNLLQSKSLRSAFQLDDEPAAVRDAYGTHLFGKGALLARRLLEAGATFVTVYWHYEGPDDSPVWDTHWNNFRHLRTRLAEPVDRAVSAVLTDLADRGLLDDTLVLCFGEFGRSPRINTFAGRDHWPHVFSALVAGAGIPGGSVFGSSDLQGAYPAQSAVTAQEFHSTVLQTLGIPREYEVHDQFGRPYSAATAAPRPEIFT